MVNFYEFVIIFAKILFILFFFGFCIFIHEFGHLLAAMWRGLYIEKFSVGFGKPIYKWRRNNIDYLISWLPFGGYVALPQLDPSDSPKTSAGDPLPLAKPLDRTITAFAGPLFNILFGFFLAVIIWKLGIEGPAPAESFTVGYIPATYTDADGTIYPNPEYEAGLEVGDVIVAVNGEPFTKGWQEALEMIVYSSQGRAILSILREGKPKTISYNLVPNPEFEGLGYPFMSPLLPTRVASVMDDSPAMKAGVEKGDILIEINDQKVINAELLIEKIQQAGTNPITLKVKRNDHEKVISNIIAEKKLIDEKERNVIGIQVETSPSEFVRYYPTPFRQFSDVITRTYKTFRGLFDEKNPIRPKHMSGPIGIFHMLYVIVSNVGTIAALNLIIVISFSLAIINLFPLPILDGGHITIGLIEMIFRRRMPNKVILCLSYTFVVLIVGFMLYITYHDAKRVGKSFYPPKRQSINDKVGITENAEESNPKPNTPVVPPDQ